MKKAGDLLSAILDEEMRGQAREYSELFRYWARITENHGIAAAADHSRIRELERNVLLVEADHPGWIQILQTKGHKLLADLQSRFPGMAIEGISFRLSRDLRAEPAPLIPAGPADPAPEPVPPEEPKPAYQKITDERLKKSLKSLERIIRARK